MGNMDTTKCISDLDFKAYAAGNLDAKEVETLHAHTAGCEICADMLAGIHAMQDKKQLEFYVDSISGKIDARLAQSSAAIANETSNQNIESGDEFLANGPNHKLNLGKLAGKETKQISLYSRWIAAAAILLIVGFGLLQFQKEFETGMVAKQESPINTTEENNKPQVNSDAQIEEKQNEHVSAMQSLETPKQFNATGTAKAQINSEDDAALKNLSRNITISKLAVDAATDDLMVVPSIAESEEPVTAESKVNVSSKKEDLVQTPQLKSTISSQESDAILSNKTDEEKVVTAQISAKSKAQQRKSKRLSSLPSNIAFSNHNEIESVQNNNASRNEHPNNSIKALALNSEGKIINDSLVYHQAIGQYDRHQLDSAMQSTDQIMPYPQLPYYQKCIKLRLLIMEKKKSGK